MSYSLSAAAASCPMRLIFPILVKLAKSLAVCEFTFNHPLCVVSAERWLSGDAGELAGNSQRVKKTQQG
jgi:hypothetical protein